MKIIFIYPSMGKKEDYRIRRNRKLIKTSCLEPLAIATLAGLTPVDWNQKFFDDRVESIDYDEPCDLVGISVETYTAKRAYEISSEFRKKGRKVILGGIHPSLLPDEAIEHADSILIGEAENIWSQILDDVKNNSLKRIYRAESRSLLNNLQVDRGIFKGKEYFPFTLVETGRGCNFACDFCSVKSFFKGKYQRRPVEEIIEEVKGLNRKKIMFVDDNITADFKSAKKLFKALIPLKITWISQASINIVQDEELLDLMQESGCLLLLIGFESLNINNLKQMNKSQNYGFEKNKHAINELYRRKIKIWASFVIGYDFDDSSIFKTTIDYAIKNRFFLTNFYQLTPFPQTKLYKRLKSQNRLLLDKWWLDSSYSYGDVVYKPSLIPAKEISEGCKNSRIKFYQFSSIIKRAFDFKVNSNGFIAFILFLIINFFIRKEINEKQTRKLGRNYEH